MRKSVFYFIVIALLSIIFTSYSPAANAQAACTPGNAVPCPNGGSCQCAGNGCFCDTTVFPVCNPAGDVVKQCGGQNYDCVFRNGTYGCVSYPDPGTTGNPNDTGGGGAVITPIDRGGSCWIVNDNEVPQNKLTPTCAPTVRRTPTPAPS